MPELLGGGSIVNKGASAALTIAAGTFTGVISGNTSLDITGTFEFTNVNTYTGSTTIESGDALFLLSKGSVAGTIIDNGLLYVDDSSGTYTTGLISGTGNLQQRNVETLVLDHASTAGGVLNIAAGKTLVGNAKGFGTGTLVIDNATVVGTATETVTNALTLQGTDTLAAATGKTMTLTGGSLLNWDATSDPLTLTFGDAADKGTVVMGGASSLTENSTNPFHVKVADGTLKDANGRASRFLLRRRHRRDGGGRRDPRPWRVEPGRPHPDQPGRDHQLLDRHGDSVHRKHQHRLGCDLRQADSGCGQRRAHPGGGEHLYQGAPSSSAARPSPSAAPARSRARSTTAAPWFLRRMGRKPSPG